MEPQRLHLNISNLTQNKASFILLTQQNKMAIRNQEEKLKTGQLMEKNEC